MNILEGRKYIKNNNKNYKIINTLSVGGKGCVYLIEDENKNRFALKVFYHHEYEKDALSKLLVKDNNDLIKSNSYEFILPIEIFKININDKIHTAFITRYVEEGKNIDGFIKTFKLDKDFNYNDYLKKALKVIYNITDAFSQLHKKGYCYSNIDQSTIRINTSDLNVYIIKTDDILDKNNNENDKLGSIRYVAPERIEKNLPPSCRTDRYSLFVIFFELISMGLHPYIGSKTYNDYVESSITFGPFIKTTREYKTMSNYILEYSDIAPFIFSKNVKPEVYDEDIKNYYNIIPKELRDIFKNEFENNVREPKNRIHLTEFKNILKKINL